MHCRKGNWQEIIMKPPQCGGRSIANTDIYAVLSLSHFFRLAIICVVMTCRKSRPNLTSRQRLGGSPSWLAFANENLAVTLLIFFFDWICQSARHSRSGRNQISHYMPIQGLGQPAPDRFLCNTETFHGRREIGKAVASYSISQPAHHFPSVLPFLGKLGRRRSQPTQSVQKGSTFPSGNDSLYFCIKRASCKTIAPIL